MKEAIIFQNKDEINFFKEKNNLKNYDIYAWSPEAIQGLKELKLKYFLPGDLNKKKFCYKKRLNLIQNYRKFLIKIDGIFNKTYKLKYKFYPFANLGIGIRNLFFFYHIELEILKNILDKNYKKIFYFSYEKNFGNISKILDLIKKKKLVRLNTQLSIKKNEEKIYNTYFENIYKNTLKNIIKKNLIRSKNFLKNKTKVIFNNYNNSYKKNVLIINSDFKNIENIIYDLKKKKYNIFFWDNFSHSNLIDICKKNFFCNIEKKQLKKCFPNLEYVFFNEYIYDLKKILPNINFLYSNLKFFSLLNKTYNFNKVIAAYDSPLALAISDYLENIKSFCKVDIYTHGGSIGIYKIPFFPFQPDFIKKSGSNTNWFVYTKRIKDNQKRLAQFFKTKTNYEVRKNEYYKDIFIKNNFEIKKKDKYNICIVVGQFASICENNFGILRKANMYNAIIDIVNTIHKFDHLNVSIKCSYNFELEIPDTFKKDFPSVKIIKSNQYLTDHIHNFDMFILPSLGSAFSEICCTNKVIFVYLDTKIPLFEKKALEGLKKRTFYKYSYKNFIKKLKTLKNKNICDKIVYNSKNIDKTFFKNYCLEDTKL